MGYIPWGAIAEWAKFKDLDEEDLADLVYFIRAMDKVFVDIYNEKAKANKDKK